MSMKEESLIAALSYVGVLVLIPVFAGKTNNSFVAMHLRRGAMLLAGEIIAIVLAQFFPAIGAILFLLFFLASVLGFFFAIQGKQYA